MANLIVEQGGVVLQKIELHSELTLLGRHPACDIQLNDVAISRQHARIVQHSGVFSIEDLHSRNRTLLNEQSVEQRSLLKHGDRIRICSFVFRFDQPEPEAEVLNEGQEQLESDTDLEDTKVPAASSTIGVELMNEGKFDEDSGVLSHLDFRPALQDSKAAKAETKLNAVLEINKALGATLEVQGVLEKITEQLHELFPQADSQFIILKDRITGELRIPAQWHCEGIDVATAKASRTIVEHAMQLREGVLSQNLLEDSRFTKSESIHDMELNSTMCVPLLESTGDSHGAIQLVSHDIRDSFDQEDLDLLQSVGSQVSLAIQNARLHEQLLKQREYERELEFAMRVQLGFLPNERPQISEYEFSDYYEAAKHVGGDYFDYVKLPDDRLAILLGDVAGKGIPAALLMARLLSSTRYHLMTHETAKATLTALNAELSTTDIGFRFITLVLMVLDLKTQKIQLVNAGHMAPLLVCPEGKIESLGQEESGMPIGITPDQEFQEIEFELQPGESIVIYTDGITESMDANEELFGHSRLKKSLSKQYSNVESLVNQVIRDVDDFSEKQDQSDDMCLVAFRRGS